MTEKYVLKVDIDYETGEEHCSVLKTDGTTNMVNWIEIVSAMYTHHSILEPLVDELNKIQNSGNNTEKENKQLKTQIKIFEKFLNENNLDIDWENFCTVDECKKDSDDYGCKECEYLGDVDADCEEKSCGYCKHFQLDGMFGIWCDKEHNWREVEYCSDWER